MSLDSDIQEIRSRSDIDEIRQELMYYPNVWSTGFGNKLIDDNTTNVACLMVYVNEKPDNSDLDNNEIIPESIDGIYTDIRLFPENEIAPTNNSFLNSNRRNGYTDPYFCGNRVYNSDGEYGTLGAGVIGPTGKNLALTNHHSVSTRSFGSQIKSETIGQNVYEDRYASEPHDEYNDVIGTVVNASDRDNNEADWALIEFSDSTRYTNEIYGFDSIGNIQEPSFSDRIVMSGARTGLVGAELISVDFASNYGNLYEFSVDQDHNIAGNSGSLVGTIKNNTFHPFGLQFAENSNNALATQLTDVFAQSGASLDTSTYSGTITQGTYGTDNMFEHTVIDYDNTNRTVDILVANCGYNDHSANLTIETESGYQISTTPITLNSNEKTIVTTDWTHGATATIQSTDIVWTIDMDPYFDKLPIKPPTNLTLENIT